MTLAAVELLCQDAWRLFGASGYSGHLNEEYTMPKGEQRSNKMVKKPKKDKSAPQDSSSTSTRPAPPVTIVPPKGKLKNK